MQRITVLCVGKLKEKFYADAAAEYCKRLSRYCKIEVTELPETRLPEDPSPAEIKRALAAEANAIRQKLEGGAVVAMCIEGQTCSSEALSKKLAAFALEGNAGLVVRPSGTEPKVKAYVTATGTDAAAAAAMADRLTAAAKELLK